MFWRIRFQGNATFLNELAILTLIYLLVDILEFFLIMFFKEMRLSLTHMQC